MSFRAFIVNFEQNTPFFSVSIVNFEHVFANCVCNMSNMWVFWDSGSFYKIFAFVTFPRT